MKKFLKVSSIILLIVNVLLCAVCILCLLKPEGVGAYIVSLYEEITNNVGHTVDGMFNKLALFASISAIVSLIVTTILLEVSCTCACHEEHKENAEVVEGEEAVEEKNIKYKTRIVLGKTAEQVVEHLEKKIAKKVKKEKAVAEPVVEEVAPAVEEKPQVQNKPKNKAEEINAILESLRNKKR